MYLHLSFSSFFFTLGEFFAPFTECQIPPPTAPITKAPPKSLRITQGLLSSLLEIKNNKFDYGNIYQGSLEWSCEECPIIYLLSLLYGDFSKKKQSLFFFLSSRVEEDFFSKSNSVTIRLHIQSPTSPLRAGNELDFTIPLKKKKKLDFTIKQLSCRRRFAWARLKGK